MILACNRILRITVSALKLATAYFNVSIRHSPAFKESSHRQWKKTRLTGTSALGVGSPIPGRRSHELFLLPTAGEEVFVWLLRGRGAPGSVRRAGPAHCAIWRRAAGKLQPGSAGRARARPRPARGCGSRAASGPRPGGLGGSEARANARR